MRLRADSAGAIRLDGLLTEPVWREATPIADFRQREPLEGEVATERTEVRVLFAGDVLYVGITAYDRQPQQIVSRILARDKVMEAEFDGRPKFGGDDAVAILFDPFHDHRNGFVFATNPNGAEFDALLTDEGKEFNVDWRGIWHVSAKRTPEGWSAEFAIPFRTLRYPADGGEWGFNVYRMIRRKNEEVLWQSWRRGNEGFARVSRAGHLEGLTGLPRPGANVDVKPYVLGGGNEEIDAGMKSRSGVSHVGADLKSEVRPGLVLDLSYNTDFAQIEVDDQQVNLTRFSLFFPEKREFFLENSGIFGFGAPGRFEPPPFLAFFSRRIGINADSGEVPLLGGGRLTGRVGGQTVGILSAFTAAKYGDPRTAFNVARVKRDVGGAGYVGAMLVDRRNSETANTVGGLDWSLWPTGALNLQGFAARTSTEGDGGEDMAWRVAADYRARNGSASLSHLMVGPDAEADAGFVTRTGIRSTSGNFRYVFRPGRFNLRQISASLSPDLVTGTDGRRQDWNINVGTSPEWNTADDIAFFYSFGRSRVDEDFFLADTVLVPAGDYGNTTFTIFGSTGPARPVVLNVDANLRRTFGGTVNSVTAGLSATPGMHLGFKVEYTRSDASLPNGSFVAHLVSFRSTYAFTTRLSLNSLLQYNNLDRQVSANVRLNYIFRPGSDIFLVLNEERGSESAVWDPRSRGVRLKVTYLARL
ncbi:MAG: hypothetical protein MNPFHGCM_02137 [Gemmatimonadaceae bacterium]|nr:hypothetical protein [Gemmatimonadaceae bacterium]